MVAAEAVLAEAARRTLKGTISPSPEIIADIARSSSNFTFVMFSKHFLRWGWTTGEGMVGEVREVEVVVVEVVAVAVAVSSSG